MQSCGLGGISLILAFLACGIFVCAQARQTVQPQVPQLKIDETEFDYGPVFAGEEISHIFIIRNEGTVTLKLQEDTPKQAFLFQEWTQITYLPATGLLPGSSFFGKAAAPS